MYSTASFTRVIFSASSSGISMPNSSSKAITSSTVSSESAPRSSTNEASSVTFSGSTPSSLMMMSLTFDSMPSAISASRLSVLDHHAAINHDHLSGDVPRGGAGQEADHAGHILAG